MLENVIKEKNIYDIKKKMNKSNIRNINEVKKENAKRIDTNSTLIGKVIMSLGEIPNNSKNENYM